MSFREIRNFTEILKVLGYRRMISFESFRQSNFRLVADILIWLVKRFDMDYNISDDCSTSEHRVLLIRSVTEFMILKTGLRLNMKKLYMADGHAVKEMLKIVSLLYAALKIKQTVDEDFSSFTNVDLSAKIQELKLTRELALQITSKGSCLFELLSKETNLRELRLTQATAHVDINEIETLIKNIINETNKNTEQIQQQIENISSTENNLTIKLSKKETDYERVSKRLETLKSVRPAFLEEYERYEDELNQIYESYITKFRCYTYLQQQLQQLHDLNQNIINVEAQDQENILDNMLSVIDDQSSSSSSSADQIVKKPSDPVTKAIGGRIRTAVDSSISKNKMYGNAKNEIEDLDDDDEAEDDFLDGDSLLNDNDTDDDSESHSDIREEKLSDTKSDDAF